MSLAKVKMGCLCYGPLRILWAAIRNSFFFKLMANVIWNALRSVRRCHLLHAVVAYQSKSVETEDSYSVWLLVPATVTSLRRVLFFLQLTNANRYSFAPQCKYFSLLCGLKRTWPRTISHTGRSGRMRLHYHCSDTPVSRHYLCREHVGVLAPARPLWILRRVHTHMQNRSR